MLKAEKRFGYLMEQHIDIAPIKTYGANFEEMSEAAVLLACSDLTSAKAMKNFDSAVNEFYADNNVVASFSRK